VQRVEAAHRDRAAFHVGVHVEHALVRLQVGAAGIETNTLAHQADFRRRGSARTIGQAHDSRIARGIGARDGQERSRTQALEVGLAVEFKAQAQAPGNLLQVAAVGARIEGIGRQRREPSGEVVAGGSRERDIQVGEFRGAREVDARQTIASLGLALERGEAKRGRLERRNPGAQRGIGGLGGAALLPYQERLRIAVEGGSCVLAGRLQPLEGAGVLGHAGHDQERLRLRSDAEVKTISGLAHLARIQCTQHGAVRQRLPVRDGGTERQEHDCARISGEPGFGYSRADLAHGNEQTVERQTSGHIVKPQANPLLDREKPNPEDSVGRQRSSSQRNGAVTCLPS
jgi:hypothetical protein